MNSISRISATGNRLQPGADIPWPQRANHFDALQTALQSGNIWAARQAFAALSPDQQDASQAASTTSASGQNSSASTALQALQGALTSGNLSAAKDALATLQLDCSA
jgi:hypothetical protein